MTRTWIHTLLTLLIVFAAYRACAEEMCGFCGATPEQIFSRFGKPTKDTQTICGEGSPQPYQCRKVEYETGFLIKETHLLSFIPASLMRKRLPAFLGEWGLAVCVSAKGSQKAKITTPCAP